MESRMSYLSEWINGLKNKTPNSFFRKNLDVSEWMSLIISGKWKITSLFIVKKYFLNRIVWH